MYCRYDILTLTTKNHSDFTSTVCIQPLGIFASAQLAARCHHGRGASRNSKQDGLTRCFAPRQAQDRPGHHAVAGSNLACLIPLSPFAILELPGSADLSGRLAVVSLMTLPLSALSTTPLT
jgi:hypothetical protein